MWEFIQIIFHWPAQGYWEKWMHLLKKKERERPRTFVCPKQTVRYVVLVLLNAWQEGPRSGCEGEMWWESIHPLGPPGPSNTSNPVCLLSECLSYTREFSCGLVLVLSHFCWSSSRLAGLWNFVAGRGTQGRKGGPWRSQNQRQFRSSLDSTQSSWGVFLQGQNWKSAKNITST